MSKSIKRIERTVGSLGKIVTALEQAETLAAREAEAHLGAIDLLYTKHAAIKSAQAKATRVKENFKQLLGGE